MWGGVGGGGYNTPLCFLGCGSYRQRHQEGCIVSAKAGQKEPLWAVIGLSTEEPRGFGGGGIERNTASLL